VLLLVSGISRVRSTDCPACSPGYYASTDCACTPCAICGGVDACRYGGVCEGIAYCAVGCSPCVDSFSATAANIAPFNNIVPPVFYNARMGSVTFDTSVADALLLLPGGSYLVSYSIPAALMDSYQVASFLVAEDVSDSAIRWGLGRTGVYEIMVIWDQPICVDVHGTGGTDVPCTGSMRVTAQPYLGMVFTAYWSADKMWNWQPSWTISWVPVCSDGTYSSSGAPPCAACGTCTSGYYISSSCTTTTNTVCSACETCSAGTYNNALCTCTDCSVCGPGYYVSTACSPISDTVCAPCDVCGGTGYCTAGCSPCVNSFSATAANIAPFGNFVPPVWCSAATGSVTFDTSVGLAFAVLPGGDYTVTYSRVDAPLVGYKYAYFMKALGVDAAAIENSPPENGLHEVTQNGEWEECLDYVYNDYVPCTGSFPSGRATAHPYLGLLFRSAFEENFAVQPSWTISWVGACSVGTYSSSGAPPCAACGTCTSGYYISSSCTATTNTVCSACGGDCSAGTYSPAFCAACIPCATCGAGQYVGSPCTATSNTGCVACGSCTSGHYISSPCTGGTNTVCSACGACSAGTYSATPCTGTTTTDAGCSPCATCGAGQYVGSPCTATSNTACRACSVCGPGHYVSSPCTGTSDAVCALCPAMYHCQGTSQTACPPPSVSPAGSSSFLNCSCPVGTAGRVTDAGTALCSPCLPGWYCPGSGCQC
jgi:TNFR/NGFR cysteine-rich region